MPFELVFITVFCCAVMAAPLPSMKPELPISTQLSSTTEQKKDLASRAIAPWMSYPYKTENPLTKREIQLYQEIIILQNKYDWEKADLLLNKISNSVLFGHIHADRILNPKYNASPKEMALWFKRYQDHPQAARILRILRKRDTDLAKGLTATYKQNIYGTVEELRYFAKGSKYFSEKYKSGERYELNLVRKEIQKYLDKGSATAALTFFDKHRVNEYIDPIDKAQILADIAAVYLYLGHKDSARKISHRALQNSDEAPIAGWVAGLTAWLEKDYKSAAKYFTMSSKTQYASPWMTAAAAYWGARASTRAGEYKEVSALLATAVKNQRTFYGLIATRALGYGYDFNWTMPEFTTKMKNTLMRYPAGARAVALAETGQNVAAQNELFALPVLRAKELHEPVIAFANYYNLAGFALKFSSAVPNPAGGYYDAGLYPISSWTKNINIPTINEELLNAFIRQESSFDTNAYNQTGATGLMQVLPSTAAYITKNPIYTHNGTTLLRDPRRNVTIGARYLEHLLTLDSVKSDLFGLAIAYNAGPGKLFRWKRDLKIDDPLLFIELIPSSETRAFVERVATNYWIYQMRAGKTPVTLESVASGTWPRYSPSLE